MTPTELVRLGERLRDSLVADGMGRLWATRFVIGKVPGGGPRHFAATAPDGKTILIAPELAGQPADVHGGILMHELGHAADFLYPAQLELGVGVESSDVLVFEKTPSDAEIARWRARGHDTVERFADAVAERAFGVSIGYRGTCLVQSITSGIRPRPRGLR